MKLYNLYTKIDLFFYTFELEDRVEEKYPNEYHKFECFDILDYHIGIDHVTFCFRDQLIVNLGVIKHFIEKFENECNVKVDSFNMISKAEEMKNDDEYLFNSYYFCVDKNISHCFQISYELNTK